jgi:hypothetical protein
VNFPLRLPELSGLSLRSLGSWLNPVQQLDSVLVRYSLRGAVITMLAVAIYKWFDVQRGYWIAFTVLVVLQPDYGSTRQRAGQRIAGTLTRQRDTLDQAAGGRADLPGRSDGVLLRLLSEASLLARGFFCHLDARPDQ